MNHIERDFFVTGGALRVNARSYVERPADHELREQAAAGQLCYVLTTRQMGKSSLMVRTEAYLRKQGIHTAIVDLTGIGHAPIEKWYLSLLDVLQSQLPITTDAEEWWEDNSSLANARCFTKFVQEVIPDELDSQVVIFIDEIDSMLNLDFADDFFAAIRSIHNQGAMFPTGPRVSFVLLGVAAPGDLIKDQTRTPFNIGTRIGLDELTLGEAQILVEGLPGRNQVILERIFFWTNGHPYLTQVIGSAIVSIDKREWTDSAIDALVEHLFLTDEAAAKESNLRFVSTRINSSDNKNELLSLYRSVYEGKKVVNNEQSISQNELKLYGLLRADEEGDLVVRNRIYQHVFNRDWIKENSPTNRWRVAAIFAVVIAILVLLNGYFFIQQTHQSDEVLAQSYITNFEDTTNPTLRLDNLANLFALENYDREAFVLFNMLTPDERVALFENITPDLALQVRLVVKGIYQTLYLDAPIPPNSMKSPEPCDHCSIIDIDSDDQPVRLIASSDLRRIETTRLLKTMLVALEQSDDAESRALRDEIDTWLQGRKYASVGNYDAARTAYDIVVGFNDKNIATRFERALTSAVLFEFEAAINDLIVVWDSGSNWEQPVLNVFERDKELYQFARNMNSPPTFIEQVPVPYPEDILLDVSPSGHILFVSDYEFNDEIFVMDPDGGNLQRLTDNRARDWVPNWSKDGEKILFTSDRDGDMEIYRMNKDGSNVIQLTDNERFDCCAKWSPDGTQIAFNANGLEGPQDIYVMYADGSNIRNITNDPGEDWGADWSPDGTMIAFNSGRLGQRDVYVINVDGTNLQNLTNHPDQDIAPAWSPDGEHIAFYSDREGNYEVFVMAADGSNPTNLTNDPGSDHGPNWSPDGNWLTFHTFRHGQPEIYIMKADGSEQTRLTYNDSEDTGSRWGP